MEILTLLRLDGRRLAALTALGIVTGGIAAGAVSTRPATYESSTTVFVAQALPAGSSAFDVGPIVADFEKVITLPQVREAAATQLGLDPLEVMATTARNGSQGASVEVIAEGSTAAEADALSRGLSIEAMRFLAQRELDRATTFEKERREAVDEAQATVQKLLSQNGFASPVRTYEETMTRYVQLTLDKSDPTQAITNEQRVAADAETTRLRLQLPTLQQLASDYEKAEQDLADARASLQAAKTTRAAAEDVLVTATTEVAISPGETVRTSQIAVLAQAFVAALVATLVTGTAFFYVVDGRRHRRAASRPRPAAAANGAGSAAKSSPAASSTSSGKATTTGANPAPAKTGTTTPAKADTVPKSATESKPDTASKPATGPGGATTATTATTGTGNGTAGNGADNGKGTGGAKTADPAKGAGTSAGATPIDLRDDTTAPRTATAARPGGLPGTDSVFNRPSKDTPAAGPTGTQSEASAPASGKDDGPGRNSPSGRRRLGR
jgi:hypothetical protein